MAILKRNNNSFPSLPSMFDNFFSRDWMDWSTLNYSSTNTTLPAVNIRENDNEYQIEVAAPGMRKDDFKINLDKDHLIISSVKNEERHEKSVDDYYRKEFSYQSFQRSFSLPERYVDEEKITARYNDGILYVTLPKREEVKPKPAREIRIG